MLPIAFAMAIFAVAVLITTASAGVHNNNTFELDANVADAAGGGADWQTICDEFNDPASNAACDPLNSPASGASRILFITDSVSPADDQPATGATKDPNDINGWDCKAAAIS